jgi:hypothetical protein
VVLAIFEIPAKSVYRPAIYWSGQCELTVWRLAKVAIFTIPIAIGMSAEHCTATFANPVLAEVMLYSTWIMFIS